ncbi:MAG: ATP-binding protein [Desulfobacula sp.]|jgi:two-component system sensor histidine kinase BaeS
MKLSHKLFSVHLLVSFVLLILVGATFEFYASRQFENEILTILSYELALEYQRSGNWDEFRNNPGSFDAFIRTALGNRENRPLSNALPGPRPPEGRPFPPHPGIALYDAGKTRIAGPDLADAKILSRPILLHAETIGWIGLYKEKHPPGPGKGFFFKDKYKIFYTVGIIVFILAGLVSYGLSRHILSPVGRLTAGTKALTSFRFDTRIHVRTTDELGLLAKDFNRMAQTLETYETMRKQWAVDISHELRTPLSVLKGELEAILDGIRPFSRERMESLHAEILYLERIVNDLHFLSMADAGALTLKKEPVRPVDILKTVLSLFETRLKQEGLTVLDRLTCDNKQVSGDRDRIRQLFSNLIDNNLKYTRKPGTLTLQDKIENRMLVIHITDSGPGVPPDALDKLFNRLFRVDRSRSREHGGSGLGLSICKTIAAAHDGEIIAVNTKDPGLSIILRLPLI